MITMKDRIEIPDIVSTGRYEDIPKPYMLHIREQFNDDGSVTTIHRKRVYDDSLIHARHRIVDEEL